MARTSQKFQTKVYGIKEGTLGLISDNINVIELTNKHFEGNLMRMGGTFLGTSSKGNPFRVKKKHGIETSKSDKSEGM